MHVSIASKGRVAQHSAHCLHTSDGQRLVFSEGAIRRDAGRHGPGPIALLAVRYAFEAARLQWGKHLPAW